MPRAGTDEEAAGDILDYYEGKGAVAVLARLDRAQLLEWLDGEGELSAMVGRGEDEAASRIIASVVGRLHARRAGRPPAGVIPLERQFRALLVRDPNRSS